MILSERQPSFRASTWVVAGAGLMGLLSLPAWSAPSLASPSPSEPAAAAVQGDGVQEPPVDKRAPEPKRGRSDNEQAKPSPDPPEERLERAIAAVEVVTSIVARNQRLNALKPGSVSAEGVAEAEAELEMARAQYEFVKLTLEAAARKEQAWARANAEKALAIVAINQRSNARKPGAVSAEEVAKAEAELERARSDESVAARKLKVLAAIKPGAGLEGSMKRPAESALQRTKEAWTRELGQAAREKQARPARTADPADIARRARLEKLQRRLEELHAMESELKRELEVLTREVAEAERKPEDR
jgi:hypothetical protein